MILKQVEIEMIENEIWKSLKGIVEYGDYYEVSNLGRVRSLSRVVETKRGKRKCEGRILKPSFSNGYLVVSLCENKKQRTFTIHRLVAIAFIENPENKKEVNHKNGIKHDNCIENLEWVTPKENIKHAIENGLINNRGSNNGESKLTESEVREIRFLIDIGEKQVKIAKMFDVSDAIISSIKLGKNWSHVS